MVIHSDDKTLLQLHEKKGLTYAELADMFNMSRGQVAGRIHRFRKHLNEGGVKPNPELFYVSYGHPLTLSGDWVIVGDVHVPCTDYEFAGLVTKMGKHFGVKKLLVAGDLYNMDTFSLYTKAINSAQWQHEKLAAKHLLAEWLEWFDEIVFLMGNHERRLERLGDGAFTDVDVFSHLYLHGKGKVSTSQFGWCVIETVNGKFRVTHPRNYSINQLVVADQLASKFQMNIIGHHEHHLAKGWDRFKNFVIVNSGGLFDPEKFAYVNLDDSKSAGMAKGFTVLSNGVPHVFGETPFTDWSLYE